jgi:hypothetical protein
MTRMAKEVLLARRKTCRFSDDEDLVFTLIGEPLNPEKVSKRFGRRCSGQKSVRSK